ncbi:MAG TPA: choice-of-anchor Q domain-containing protein, partial [Gemmataceae bacterium]|nr:choice-of-anchor Q domain-containing protein [Gemmataceae bacterium]
MTLRSWIEKLVNPLSRRPRGAHRPAPRPQRWANLRLEYLEDRLAPATITVMNNSDGVAPGPAGSLRNAINTSANGDAIIFTPSLAGQTITLTSGSLGIVHNLTILGLGANLLAVSGNHNIEVFIVNPGTTVQMTGLTIENGNIPAPFTGGGGILNAGTLTLTACTISGNTATGQAGADGEGGGGGGAGIGGGICNYGGTLTMQSCTVSGNVATGGKGGNGNANGSGGNGGGGTGGAGSVVNSGTPGKPGGYWGGGGGGSYTLGGNGTAGGAGGRFAGGGGGGDPGAAPGGLANYSGKGGDGDAGPLAGGGGGGGSGLGGGLFNRKNGTVTITNCTFSGNIAQGGNGGNAGGGTAVGGNAGSGLGAGIWNSGTMTITSSTIAANTALPSSGGSGGGKNQQGFTGGVANDIFATSPVRVDSSIIAKNTDTGGAPDVLNSFTDVGYNLIGNTSGSLGGIFGFTALTTITGADPLLNALGNYGGPTQTMSLRFNSPALNNGDPANGVTIDERGAVRGASTGPGSMANAGTMPDIGAWEASSLNIVTANFIGGLVGDSSN